MIPKIKPALMADSATQAIIADRVYPNRVPLNGAVPAVVFQMWDGSPENYLESNPTMDSVVLQITCWAEDVTTADDLANKARAVLEKIGTVVRFIGSDFDPETNWECIRFDVRIWNVR